MTTSGRSFHTTVKRPQMALANTPITRAQAQGMSRRFGVAFR